MTRLNNPSFVGFESLFDRLERTTQNTYPPHNLVHIDDTNEYVLQLALAGFDRSDLAIILEKGTLTIQTKDDYEINNDGASFIHRGISSKKFRKSFTISESIEVKSATMLNGILTISMEEIIPEALKPKYIDILDSDKSPKELLLENT